MRRVELDPMPLQEGDPFLLEGSATMMLLLVLDVAADITRCRPTDAEGRVALLPAEAPRHRGSLMNPSRRIGLDHPKQVGQRHARPRTHQQMHVVRHTSNGQQRASFIPDESRDERIEHLTEIRLDERLSILCAEDDVVEELAEGVGHSVSAFPEKGGGRIREPHI